MSNSNALINTTDAYARATQSGKTNYARPTNENTGTTESSSADETQTMSFADFVDFINPLQHIPVIGTLYRAITDDQIQPSVQVAGDILFGGLAGGGIGSALLSITNAAISENNDFPVDVQIAQSLFGSDSEEPTQRTDIAIPTAPPKETKVAQAETTKPAFGGIMDPAVFKGKPPNLAVVSPTISVGALSGAATAQTAMPFAAKDPTLTETMMLHALEKYQETALSVAPRNPSE